MRRIDELHLELPFAGARMLRDLLRAEGFAVGRKHMTTLMRRMAITALYRKPNTSKKVPGQTIWPYLLRTLAITRSNHVWAMDISYIPMARGFVYLAADIDWHSRKVLAWRLSISMDTAFCTEAVEEAIARYGKPEIFNTDQGSQGRFNRSLQHLKRGDVQWDDPRDGQPNGQGERRCSHRAARKSINGLPSRHSGNASRRAYRARMRHEPVGFLSR